MSVQQLQGEVLGANQEREGLTKMINEKETDVRRLQG